TCSSVSCHGGNPVQWGANGTVSCSNCHTGTSDVPSYAFGTAGVISSTEWTASGHGQTTGVFSGTFNGATDRCLYCHDNTVGHDVSANPFRLRGVSVSGGTTSAYDASSAAAINAVCTNCHGTGTIYGVTPAGQPNVIGLTPFRDAYHYGAKHTGDNGGQRCWDCHDPHGDGNIKMVGKTVVQTSADAHGFTATRVGGPVSFTADTAWGNFVATAAPYTAGLCNVCHTTTNHFTNASADAAHNAGQVCTTCHAHQQPPNNAFSAESSGGAACTSCHSAIYAAMNGTGSGTHHHYMQNANPTAAAIAGRTLGTTSDTNRNCLVCHVDHNFFRPDLNTTNGGRAKNLRTSITAAPAVANGTTYAATDFTGVGNGICTSCHQVEQTRAYADGGYTGTLASTTKTAVVNETAYAGSVHNYGANNPTSTFGGTLTTTFVANCSKCHGDTMTETLQTSTNKFGLHNSTITSLTAQLGSTQTSGPLEEAACFRCHSKTTDAVGGTVKPTAGKDWYGATSMSPQAEGLYAAFQKTVGRHNVAGYAGLHLPSSDENRAYIAANKHVECADCHSPHGAGPGNGSDGGTASAVGTTTTLTDSTKAWAVNQWAGYYVTIVSGTGVGQASQITANSATVLTFLAVTTAPGAGAGYAIGARTNGGNVSSATATVLTDTTKAWSTNLWAGWTVVIQSGTGAGQAALTIASNTATALTVSGSFSPVPDATSVYRIVKRPDALTGAGGVMVATWGSTTWAGVASGGYTPSSTTAALVTASAQWQVCFKCHSGANANVTSWVTGTAGFTDVAQEFNPNNGSYHPIARALPVTDPGVNGSSQIQPYRLVNGWRPGDLMTCTDCHNNDSVAPASQGPHGSAIKFMLAGVNKAWPYTLASQNGGSTGTLFDLNSTSTNLGTVNGLFCRNCHGNMGGSAGTTAATANWIHATFRGQGSDHNGRFACVYCHIRVPHGGKISRLVLTPKAPARYQVNPYANLASITKPATGEMNGSSSFQANSSLGCDHTGTARSEAW
ncbi:MAG TPA: hypothetical protein VML50_02025, partial [Anaeromyxobacter sp.]|nr:hypothetical protein [Anaeromyxobacter sp.]